MTDFFLGRDTRVPHTAFIVTRNTVASTHCTDVHTIVWVTDDITCCPTQGVVLQGDTIPQLWDATGAGSWTVGTHGQCNTCGQLAYHLSIVLDGEASDSEIYAAAQKLAAERAEDIKAAAAGIREGLLQDLSDFIKLAVQLDIDNLPEVTSMHEPGIGRDGDDLIAWDYDPAHPDGEGGIFLEERIPIAEAIKETS